MIENSFSKAYTFSNKTIDMIAKISEKIGIISIARKAGLSKNRLTDVFLQTAYSSVALESNSPKASNVSDLIDRKIVVDTLIQQNDVKYAIEVYSQYDKIDPYNIEDIILTHKGFMKNLSKDIGVFRNEDFDVILGENLTRMPPHYEEVPKLLNELLDWARGTDLHPLVKSTVFSYEFDRIYPFHDGNGRIGRLWHKLILNRWKPAFIRVPYETHVLQHADAYYDALEASDNDSNSTPFVEFMLSVILETLEEIVPVANKSDKANPRYELLLKVMGNDTLSSKQIMSRLELNDYFYFSYHYLAPALRLGIVERTLPEKLTSRFQKYRRASNEPKS
jgi:Fic family protein